MSKDYYKILGVAEFDSAENIKNSYRKLARKWHPDIAGNTPDVLTKFKEINEAYEVLSNEVKRAEYDRAKRFYNYAKQGATTDKQETHKGTSNTTTNPQRDNYNFKFNWEELFKRTQQKENNHKHDESFVIQNGTDIYTDIEITILEAINGAEKVVNMLQTQTCTKCNGKKFANGSLCPHCHGTGEEVSHKKFTVKIPAGIADGSKIRLAGEGAKGKNGGRNGDLYINIHINGLEYRAEGLNIYKTVKIEPYEAVLGTELKINTVNNETVSVKISPNTKNGQKIRLSECGLVQNDRIGDMIITVEVNISANLSEEEISLYKKLQEIALSKNRGGLYDR